MFLGCKTGFCVQVAGCIVFKTMILYMDRKHCSIFWSEIMWCICSSYLSLSHTYTLVYLTPSFKMLEFKRSIRWKKLVNVWSIQTVDVNLSPWGLIPAAYCSQMNTAIFQQVQRDAVPPTFGIGCQGRHISTHTHTHTHIYI